MDSTILANNNTHNKFENGGINLNYSHQFDSLGKSITFDLDYLNYNNERTQSFLNNAYGATGTFSATQLITNKLPTDIAIYSAKTDFTLPLKNKAKFAAGLKTGAVNTDNAANYYNVVGNISTVDNNNTNHFLYHENINAAYVNLNQELKRFAFQAGLRAENTNVAGHQLGNARSPDSSIVQHYTSLFPTAYVLYKLDSAGSHTLNLSYGRRIDRPYYQDLNPFVTILDKYSQFVGNSFLKPQYTSVYTLTYGYKSRLSIAVEYTDISDYQVEYDYQKGNIFVANTINLGHRIHKGINASLNLDPAKWWSFYLYTELNYNTFRGPLSNTFLDISTTYVFLNGNNQFKLSKNWSAELSYFYMSPATDGQFTHIARYQVNAGLQKKIWNNKAAIKLTARDIFRSNFSGGDITNVPNVRATYYNDFANRVVLLGFTYNFGTAAKNQKKHDSGADSEAGRVR